MVVEYWQVLWIFLKAKVEISEQEQSGCWRSTNFVWKNFRSWKAWSKIFTGSLCCHSLTWSVRKIYLNHWSRSIQMNFNFNWNLDFQVYWPDPRARTIPLQRLQRPEEAVDGCENINIQHYNVQIHCDVRISILNISVPNQAVFSIHLNITFVCKYIL